MSPTELWLACVFWQCALFDPCWIVNPEEYRRRYGAVWTMRAPKRNPIE